MMLQKKGFSLVALRPSDNVAIEKSSIDIIENYIQVVNTGIEKTADVVNLIHGKIFDVYADNDKKNIINKNSIKEVLYGSGYAKVDSNNIAWNKPKGLDDTRGVEQICRSLEEKKRCADSKQPDGEIKKSTFGQVS